MHETQVGTGPSGLGLRGFERPFVSLRTRVAYCRIARLGTLSPLSSRVSSCRFLCLVFSCLASSGLTSSFLLPSCPVSSCLASSCLLLLLACLTSGVANRHSFEWYRCFLLFASRPFGDSLRPAVLHSSVRCLCLLLLASWAV